MEKSIWDIKHDIHFQALDKDIESDILIVGGGLTGITLAYYLKESHFKVTLIEQNEIGSGVTRKTTGKLTYLQENMYSKINNVYNIEVAKLYYQSQKEAINNVVKIINDNNIACDLDKSTSIIFSKNKKKLDKEKEVLDKIGINYQENIHTSELVGMYTIGCDDNYVFHPLKYLLELTKIIKDKIAIYENTRLINYKLEQDKYIVKTNKGSIKCKYLVMCNNYPTFLFPYLFPIKTYLEKSDIYLYTKKNKQFNAINIDKECLSMRFHKDNMLYLINSRKLASDKKIEAPKGYKYMWSNYDVITSDHLPIAGKLKDNLYIITGFNTWGMTNSNICSKVVADILCNKDNPYTKLFEPNRPFNITKDVNILNNSLYSGYAWVKSKLRKDHIVTLNHKKYGLYIDENGLKHYVEITCPHMLCGLRFNEKDKTWDCICHGSKFSIDGDVIKGPSTKCIKKSQD